MLRLAARPARLAGARMHASTIARLGTDDPRMSRVVVHKDIVYTLGVTDTTASDIRGQTAAVLAKVDAHLAEAGTSKSSLLSAQIWVRDIKNDFKGMNEVWCEWLDPENKPVRACTQAEMARPEILVEVMVTCADPYTQ